MNVGEEFTELFFEEVRDNLSSLENLFEQIKSTDEQSGLIKEFFRIVHTLKGMAATMGYESLTSICHKMEALFDIYRQSKENVEESSLQIEIKAFESLKQLTEIISNSGETAICRHLSKEISNELIEEINKLNNNFVEKINNAKSEKQNTSTLITVQVDLKNYDLLVKFKADCAMPAVRAFMLVRILNKFGKILETTPQQDKLEDELNSDGFKLKIESKLGKESLENEIKKCIADIESLEISYSEKTSNTPKIDELKEKTEQVKENQCSGIETKNIWNELTDEDKKKLKSNEDYRLYQVNISLSSCVINLSGHFLNILDIFHDSSERIIISNPTEEELKDSLHKHNNYTISEIIDNKLQNKAKNNPELSFVILIEGDHNTVLQILRESGDLNSAEVDEIKLPELENKIQTSQKSKDIKQTQTQLKNQVKTSFIRVNTNIIQDIMNTVGELVTNQNRLLTALSEHNIDNRNNINQILYYIQNVTQQIQQHTMGMRMVEINQIFNRFKTFIKQTAEKLNKEVNLKIIGGRVEIDRLMVDDLNEIFTHLVRNCLDHGLETTEERIAKNKPKEGNITFQAYSKANHVCVMISDDGKGIDPEIIKRKAIEKRIISKEKAERMSSHELINLVFEPNFSTNSQVSDLSGRGVGMDVVYSKIEAIGGQVSLSSEVNKGTIFKLIIPSSISILEALTFSFSEEIYAIALSEVHEIIKLSPELITKFRNIEALKYRNEIIPLVDLSYYLNLKDDVQNEYLVLILKVNDKPYGFLVNNSVSQQKLVITPVSVKANPKRTVIGTAVSPEGKVVMALNTEQIVQEYLIDISNFV